MASLSSTLKLSLLDGVTGPIRKVNGAISSLNRQTSSMMAPIRGMTGQILAFGGAYLGVTEGWNKTYTAAADAQAALSEMGIKAGLSQVQLGVLQKRLVDLSPKVNQSTTDLMAGVDAMLTMGTAAKDAEGAIPAIGKAATATGASIADLSNASSSAMQNLGVMPAEISRMLDGMAHAGNSGAFELRDMAQYFPQLTASAQTLGIHGVEGVNDLAAALQIARRGAGDASTASNNLSDFMGKIVTPQTIKNFKKFGVDVTKELVKIKKTGVSPIEHFIGLLDKKTQGGKGELLTQIFGDKQTLDFIRPMIAGFDDYIRIRNEANKANGTVADAYARRMEDANQKVKAFQISMENLGTSIGANLLGPVGEMAEKFAKSLNNLDAHFTVFDSISSRMRGFFSGLGVDTGKGAIQGIHDLVFGAENASAAADKYGKLFGEFQEYGRSIKQFGEDVAKNPVVAFFKDLSPYYFEALKWSIGFAVVAAAIRKLAGAMMLLSGASTILGALKGLGGIYDALSGGGVDLPDRDGKKKPKGGKPKTKGALDWIESGRKHSGPTLDIMAYEAVRRWGAKALEWGGKGARFSLPLIAGSVGYEALNAVPHGTMESATKGNPDLLPGLDREQRQWGGVAFEGGRHRAGLGAGPQPGDRPLSLDSGTIGQLLGPTRGVSDVRVTNRQVPEVRLSVVQHITGVSSPEAAADAAASRLGQAVKSAVESSYSD
ncbi:phage tail tape measure protein [Shinella sp.]|uniref:phage tail tape measure protein n=1 Tax=Shinella sp. TaxID=1870904 RepID=UPI0029A905A5|nr:phage tail tape measure protein [Shinella sp.]MDX3976145.1 phage tail tape measure protein [Shinella sp.]